MYDIADKQKAIQAIVDSDKEFLAPADIAPILGVNPHTIRLIAREMHSAVLSGRWCGDQRPLCGPAAWDCQSVEFGFITTVSCLVARFISELAETSSLRIIAFQLLGSL